MAEEFEARVLEIDHLLALVVDDARGLDLPLRRFLRIVLARLAGGVDAVVEHRVVAARAFRARRRHARLIRRVEAQRVDEAVAIIVGQIHDVAVGDLAVGFGQADIALRVQALAGLVVDHLVGFDRRAAVIDLHAADGGDAMIDVVVVDLARLHEHLLLPGLFALDGGLGFLQRRALRERQFLRKRRRAGKRAHAGEQRKDGDDTGGGLPPACWWTSATPRHHPSSWYNNAIKPVRPPTSTGSQAAATGCSSSALLKSSVTLDKT